MRKQFVSCLVISFLALITCLVVGFYVFLLIVSIFSITFGFLIWNRTSSERRPGTVTYSNRYVSNKRIFTPKYLIRPKPVHRRLGGEIKRSNYRLHTSRYRNFSDFDRDLFNLRVDMDTPKRRVLEGSPIPTRSPLRMRNEVDTSERTESPSVNMTVGEFPLISLVSGLHEAVSPKPHRLKPSPLTIRIQPPSPHSEVSLEVVSDPVVSVLKQISSNKRVFVSTGGDEEQKEKRKRGIPRHDLTHSLLESQLTTSASSPLIRDVSSSKRERDDGNSPVNAGTTVRSPGNSMLASAPKRLCARSVRSNEILSSLSSSISLVSSSPPPKSYTRKRKTVCFDKYKKVRKVDDLNSQVTSMVKTASPAKVDKCVTTCDTVEKPCKPLPVVSIKRDEISERVVSRAMVSALLKSTVSKLMMSGDPSVFPRPNGTQLRQPEVTPPRFGPLEKTSSAVGFPRDTSTLPQMFGLSSQASGSVLTSDTATTSALSLTTTPQTLFSLDKPQSSLVPGVPSFGLDPKSDGKNISSIASPPKFGLSATTTGASSTPPSFGIPSTATQVLPAVPSFGIPSTSSGVLPTQSFSVPLTTSGNSVAPPNIGIPFTSSGLSSPSSFAIPSTASGITLSAPSFGLSTTTSSQVPASQPNLAFRAGSQQAKAPSTTSAPSFGLATTVVSPSATPTFSFGGSSSNEVKVSTAPPSFASVVAGSSATPAFGVGSASPASNNLFAPVPKSAAPVKFGESVPNNTTAASIFGSASSAPVLAFRGIPTTSASVTTPSSTVASSSTSLFGAMTSTAAPIFGPSSSNIGEIKTVNPPVTTTSSSIFGTSAILFSGASAAPAFGAGAGTTSSVVFGANPSVTSSSIFGGSSTPVFGAAVTTTPAPLFNSSTTTAATTTNAPMFGSFTSTSTTSTAPIFGATASTASNLFGGVSSSSATPLFSGTTTTAAPIFGGNASNPVFGSTAATTSSTTPIFGGSTTTLTPSPAPMFGGVTTATTPFVAGGTTGTFTSSGFGSSATSSTKPGESLFGMPSSSAGFKTVSPFQLGGGNEGVSSSSGFGSGGGSIKPFEFGGAKPSPGGFTFKPSGTATAFTSQTQPAAVTCSSVSFPQASFTFSGGGNTASTGSGATGTPFVFGTPQSQVAASAGAPVPAVGTAQPFQFGTPATGTAGPAFGHSFAPGFPQSSPAPNMPFASPSPVPAQTGFQFNTGSQPAPTTPGSAGGLFSIGTGSSGSRTRDRRDRRRR